MEFSLSKFATSDGRVFRLAAIVVGVLMASVGLVVDVFGQGTFLSLAPSLWMSIGLVILAISVAITVIRIDFIVHEASKVLENEHLRGLFEDGIPPIRDYYIQYVRRGDFGVANRFWRGGIFNVDDGRGLTDFHIACEQGYLPIVRGLLDRGGCKSPR